MENLLSKSIEKRAFEFIESGMDIIEAIKKAISEENKLIGELIEQKTERSKKAKNTICKNVYGLIHLIH